MFHFENVEYWLANMQVQRLQSWVMAQQSHSIQPVDVFVLGKIHSRGHRCFLSITKRQSFAGCSDFSSKNWVQNTNWTHKIPNVLQVSDVCQHLQNVMIYLSSIKALDVGCFCGKNADVICLKFRCNMHST